MNNPLSRITIIALLIFPLISFGQLTKEWEIYLRSNLFNQPSFNVNTSNHFKTIPYSDGTFVTIGSKNKLIPLNGTKIYLFKFDTSGEVIWEFNYENEADISEYPLDIAMDQEGNILVTGSVVTFHEFGFKQDIVIASYLLFKVSADGELLWEKEISGEVDNYNYASSVVVDSLGSIYTLGQLTQNDGKSVILHKYDGDGNELWSKRVDGANPKNIASAGGMLFAVTKKFSAPSSLYVFDYSGNMLDSFTVSNIGHKRPIFDDQGNFYIFNFTGQFKVNKFNSQGQLIWTYHKETNLPSNIYADELEDCIIDKEGNVYVTGRYYGEHYGNDDLYTNGDILTAKLDSDGNMIWENIYNHEGKRDGQFGRKIQVDDSGKVYVLGTQSVEVNGNIFASSDMVLLVYNDQGEIVKYTYHNGVADDKDFGINLILQDDAAYALGYSINAIGRMDYNVIKYSKLVSIEEIESANKPIKVYPNPSSGEFMIDCHQKILNVEIIDYSGRVLIKEDSIPCNTPIDLKGNPQGIYYLKYSINGMHHTQPLIINGH